jgi:hypothetical protein
VSGRRRFQARSRWAARVLRPLALTAAVALAGCTGVMLPSTAEDPGGAGPPAGGGDPGGGGNQPPGNGGAPPAGGAPGPGGGGTPAGPPGVNPPGAVQRCEREVIAPRVLRRLTTLELETTLRAAFGLTATQWPGPSFLPDPASGDGFTNNSERLLVGDEFARRLYETAREVAEQVTAALPALLPCSARGDEACAASFLDSFGPRLYRRPLTAAERARYLALFARARQQNDFKAGVYWATVALIKSPNTVYRSELGDAAGGGRFRLTPYEVASALSYAYTGGPPSSELLQLAARNQLGTAAEVEAAARTLALEGASVRPAFRAVLLRFAEQWLGLSPLENLKKDAAAFPDFTPEVQAALGEEIRRFLTSVLIDQPGKPADLFTAPHTFINGTLWAYYRIGAPVAGPDFVRVTRPAGWGLGLTGQGALLSILAGNASTSPTKRGHLVRERLLCHKVPPPPPVVGELPEPSAAETTRKRYEDLHLADPSCKSCHRLMDPVGFGLERLDASGRFRAREGRFDIDDRGELIATSLGELTFQGAEELGRALARLPETADCTADFIAASTFGLDHGQSGCLARAAGDDLRAGRIGVVEFALRMARAESFRTRVP